MLIIHKEVSSGEVKVVNLPLYGHPGGGLHDSDGGIKHAIR